VTELPTAATQALASLSRRQKWLVGVSGGRDSVFLLHALVRTGFRKLIVCHFDHRMRGRASTADARFVEALAGRLKLPFVGGRAPEPMPSCSEADARELRFRFFASAARQTRCPRVFLAHHADDQVETSLFNFLRGSGGRGVSGMRPSASQRVDGIALTLHRPLLGVWRDEIDAWMRENRIAFRDDATNATVSGSRNRIRLQLIPAAEAALDRGVREPILRAAQIAGAEEDLLEEMTASLGLPEALPLRSLLQQPLALRRRWMREWLRSRDIANVGFDVVEHALHVADPTCPTARLQLPGGAMLRRRSGLLFIE